jgi:hypothetical protein
MMAKFDFNASSSFNFGLQPTTEVTFNNSAIIPFDGFIYFSRKIINL